MQIKHHIISIFRQYALSAADSPGLLSLLTSASQIHHAQAFLYADLKHLTTHYESRTTGVGILNVTFHTPNGTQHFLTLNTKP